MTDRVAAIDCGTNSIRLLIADTGPLGLIDVHRLMLVNRLGEGVDRTGRLSAAALERTAQALGQYRAAIDSAGVGAVRMVATSASRDAENSADFTAMVRQVLGVAPEVITGRDEAELSFLGAVAGLPSAADPLLVCDIGGGSTELVLGSPANHKVLAAHSMDVGCVRMTERHVPHDMPTPEQIAAVQADLAAALGPALAEVPVARAKAFVGVAGTVTTVAALALQLPAYDPVAIHGAAISLEQVQQISITLLAMPRAERAALPAMHPGRVDVIAAGALILATVMAAVGASTVIASEHDILDGIALSLL